MSRKCGCTCNCHLDEDKPDWPGPCAECCEPGDNCDCGRALTRALAARAAGEPGEGLREALRAALPRAINFRFLPPRTVDDPIWAEVAADLAAALGRSGEPE